MVRFPISGFLSGFSLVEILMKHNFFYKCMVGFVRLEDLINAWLVRRLLP